MNFIKRDALLILAGIMLLALEFTVSVGNIRIDVFSDILAYILIIVGLAQLIRRNNIFRKCRSTAIKGLLVAVLAQVVYCVPSAGGNIILFAKGLATIFFIYFTYYFTEAVALEAKMQDKAAVSRNFRITWGVFGVFIFAYYIILNFNFGDMVPIIVQAVLVMSAVYYCYTMSGACSRLYMEGLPPHSEEALEKSLEKPSKQ